MALAFIRNIGSHGKHLSGSCTRCVIMDDDLVSTNRTACNQVPKVGLEPT